MAAFALREIFTAAICNSQAARTAEMHNTQVMCATVHHCQKWTSVSFNHVSTHGMAVNNKTKYIHLTCELFMFTCSLHVSKCSKQEKNVNHTICVPGCLPVCMSLQYLTIDTAILHRPILNMDISMSFFLPFRDALSMDIATRTFLFVKLTSLVLQTEKACQILHWVWQSVGKAGQGFSVKSLSPYNPFVEQREGSNLISRLISTNKKVPLFIVWQTSITKFIHP